MACHLFHTKPLPDPMQTDRQLDLKDLNLVQFSLQYQLFLSEKYIEKGCLRNIEHLLRPQQ